MARGGGTPKKLPGTPAGFGSQAIQTARGGQYGSQAASAAAQKAVPLPNMQQGISTNQMPAGPALTPGSVPLNMPTARPQEPISEGASFGPGRGLQDLALPAPPPAEPPIDPELFRVYLPMLEAVASQPGSSYATRSFVRRIRAMMPLGFDPTENM